MQDSELGPIPKGWRVVTFEDELEAERGLSYKGKGLATNDAVPMHNLNSVYEGGGYKFEGIKYYSGEYKEKHIVQPGDLIIANTEQGHKYLLIGYPAIVPYVFGDVGIYSHHIYRLRPRPHSYLTSDFLYQLLLRPEIREQVVGFANGTTVNMLKIEGLQKPKFVLPPRYLVSKYFELAASIRLRQEENIKQSATLAAIRDALLPKLMNGEVGVALEEII
jgi:type I restriction enzyme S subunit